MKPLAEFLGLRSPESPAGLRVVPRASGLELEVTPPDVDPWNCSRGTWGFCSCRCCPQANWNALKLVSNSFLLLLVRHLLLEAMHLFLVAVYIYIYIDIRQGS